MQRWKTRENVSNVAGQTDDRETTDATTVTGGSYTYCVRAQLLISFAGYAWT